MASWLLRKPKIDGIALAVSATPYRLTPQKERKKKENETMPVYRFHLSLSLYRFIINNNASPWAVHVRGLERGLLAPLCRCLTPRLVRLYWHLSALFRHAVEIYMYVHIHIHRKDNCWVSRFMRGKKSRTIIVVSVRGSPSFRWCWILTLWHTVRRDYKHRRLTCPSDQESKKDPVAKDHAFLSQRK
jgi:hypothetical protein